MSGRISHRSGDHSDMVPGSRATLCHLKWESLKYDPEPIRLTIGVENAPNTPPNWPNNAFVRLVARLSFGNYGGGSTYEIDIRRGVACTLAPAQALEVEVEYYKAPATFTDGPPLRVSASAVYGIAPPQKCIKTDYLGLWSGPNIETTPRLRIPAFADVGMLLTQDTKSRPASGLYLNLYGTNNGGIVLAQYDLTEKAEATVMQGAEFYTIYLDAPGRFYLNQSWTIIA